MNNLTVPFWDTFSVYVAAPLPAAPDPPSVPTTMGVLIALEMFWSVEKY